MHGLRAERAVLEDIMAGAPDGPLAAICPPVTLVAAFAEVAQGSRVRIGAQDCHPDASGAHTGDISAEMLADAGATLVILGHSERRADHGETNAAVRVKLEAAQRAGLLPVVCIGETLAEREAGQAETVVRAQLAGSLSGGSRVVIAYEPVWAIGTGRVAEASDIARMHAVVKDVGGAETPVLYGGSVKPGNAAEILAVDGVDGALVGGASLKAADFLDILRAAV